LGFRRFLGDWDRVLYRVGSNRVVRSVGPQFSSRFNRVNFLKIIGLVLFFWSAVVVERNIEIGNRLVVLLNIWVVI